MHRVRRTGNLKKVEVLQCSCSFIKIIPFPFTPTLDTFDETFFVAKIDISSKDGESIMNIDTNHAFAAESDAQVFGFQMGKNWIDKQH
jgi:hypothetical protein